MLTFEKVLEIFADYLTADETIEVYISRHGCVRVEFDQNIKPYSQGSSSSWWWRQSLMPMTIKQKIDGKMAGPFVVSYH